MPYARSARDSLIKCRITTNKNLKAIIRSDGTLVGYVAIPQAIEIVQNVIGNDQHFVFNQAIPESTWDITHDMNKHPSVTVVDSGGTEILGDITYLDSNHLLISFTSLCSGKAYLN
jgi:hypothetical protein